MRVHEANDLVKWSDKAKKVEDKKANDLVSFLQQCSPLFLCQTSSHLLSVLKVKLCLELDPVGSTVRYEMTKLRTGSVLDSNGWYFVALSQ